MREIRYLKFEEVLSPITLIYYLSNKSNNDKPILYSSRTNLIMKSMRLELSDRYEIDKTKKQVTFYYCISSEYNSDSLIDELEKTKNEDLTKFNKKYRDNLILTTISNKLINIYKINYKVVIIGENKSIRI